MSKYDFYISAVAWAAGQIVQVCLPLFLNQVVRFVEINSAYGSGDACRAQLGPADAHLCNIGLAVAIPIVFCFLLLLNSLCTAFSQQITIRMALRFRTVVIAAIFRKSMRLSSIGAGSGSAGIINNLIANDAQQFLMFAPLMHMAWTAPIFVIVSFVMLAFAVGPSFLAGVGVILVIVPFMIFCFLRATKCRAAMLKFTDERVKLINDVLNGLRVIKAYGWESAIMTKIVDAREQELIQNSRRGLWMSVLIVVVVLAPVFNAIAIFSVYAALGGEFTASRIFTALSAMNNMRFTLLMGPFLLIQYSNLRIAVKRIQGFLEVDELTPAILDRPTAPAFLAINDKSEVVEPAFACEIKGADAAWAVADPPPAKGKGKGKGKCGPCFPCRKPKVDAPAKGEGKGKEDEGEGKNIVKVEKNGKEYKTTQVLSGINFEAEAGKLTAIVGTVGCGKSSLLQCLLGKMEMLSGSSSLKGTSSLVAQQAFIINATVKRNITLSEDDNLTPENEEFYGRVLQACALKDDLAMLPGGDLTEIGERGVNLSGGQKQRISIARAVYSRASIVLLDDPLSAVDAHVGRHLMEQVVGNDGILSGKTRIFVTHQLQYLKSAHKIYIMEAGKIAHVGTYHELVASGALEEQQEHMKEESKAVETTSKDVAKIEDKEAKRNDGVLVMEEEREEGELRFSVLKAYVLAGGCAVFTSMMLMVILQQTSDLVTQSWLAAWTSGSGFGTNTTERNAMFYIGIYIGLGLAQGLFLFFRNIFLVVVHSKKAARVLHNRMVAAVLRSKIVFFDKNPLGRVLNRFTRDMDFLDVALVQAISQFINSAAGTCGGLIMICIIYPYFIIIVVVMGLAYHFFTKYFRHAARELQRLEAVSRSPIFSMLSEAQAGVATIHAYGISKLIVGLADEAVAINTGIFFIMQSCTTWLQMRLDLLAVTILLAVTLVPIIWPNLLQPGYVGLAISYAFDTNTMMKMLARMGADMEQKFNAVDRVLDYAENIEPEAPWVEQADQALPPNWPTSGHLCFKDVTMRYRPGLEPALRSISFEVKAGENIGVCGRTGSGKSSVIIALLRMTEFESGIIEVDGVNVQKLGLHSLRQRISMIPQDPVLFSASLRNNLDPLEQANSDDELKAALNLVCLGEEVEKLGGLSFKVAEGGQNFSVGQRQLLCLARAILRRSQLVLLDEATASVDQETDDFIQRTIRKEFHSSTMLTIAHRLNTILDSNRILVLEAGRVGEFDTPQNLARDPSSRFYKLLQSAGCKEFLETAAQGHNKASDGPSVEDVSL